MPLLKPLQRYLPPSALFVLTVLAWQTASGVLHIAAWLLPSPVLIVQTVWDERDRLWVNFDVTAVEVLLGLALSLVCGIVLAVAIHKSRLLERVLYPWLIASQTLPTLAIAPVLVVWFGINLTPKLIMVVLFCFFPICVNTVDGLRAVQPEMRRLMQTLGASRWRIFKEVEIPSALPHLISGVKVAATVSVLAAVAGEWVGAGSGLGYYINVSAAQLLTAQVFAAITVLSLFGVALFGAVSGLERLLLPWHHERTRSQRM